MPLPRTIPVKITSEAAGYVSFTPVRRQELSPAELVEQILGVTGKNPSRIREILSRGTFVSGGSRFRWEPFEAGGGEVERLLEPFPDEDRDRPFDPSRCTMVIFQGRRGSVEVLREAAAKRRLFQRASFWDTLMATFESAGPGYERYSYAEQADVYQVPLPLEMLRGILDRTNLLKYASIAQELRFLEPTSAELFARR